MNSNFTDYLLETTGATSCKEVEVIQSLWSGYGKISRYQLKNSSINTVVVKCISPDSSGTHPRGWNTTNSHNRKIHSYKVETNWYQQWSSLCNANCKIPSLIGSYTEGNQQWIILEDLNTNFPLRKTQLSLPEIEACLQWLANFHITFLNKAPKGLWEIGTYWHLQTRPDEFEKIEHQELKSKAHRIDELLNQCQYQTIVHGDAKLANFCFSENGKKVAAVDFQYVGGGCGIKDIAYFLGSCLSSSECEFYQDELLDFYFSVLKTSFETHDFGFDFSSLEREWRKMYPIACTDFVRFLLGWMPTHQKVNNYNRNIMNSVLSSI
ncbi:oxidoreductase family protein [Aquimarina spongiae]|uniref:Ecdysteroid kinase n=1 Tax=Aquimarina spongiae TaxID=570521 RepID=A0A1M6AA08_9FLAO|nr:oxidoreductase family protein [Aquimarina spongiae]SHI33302.1 Ecdysteroid kinase [Aquimarina spongiae]